MREILFKFRATHLCSCQRLVRLLSAFKRNVNMLCCEYKRFTTWPSELSANGPDGEQHDSICIFSLLSPTFGTLALSMQAKCEHVMNVNALLHVS